MELEVSISTILFSFSVCLVLDINSHWRWVYHFARRVVDLILSGLIWFHVHTYIHSYISSYLHSANTAVLLHTFILYMGKII